MPTWLLVVSLAALFGLRLFVDPLVADLLAVVAAGLAAWGFKSGDPPRRPWILRVVGIALVLAAHALQRVDAVYPAFALLVLANLLGAAAIVGFVQIFRRSGLSAPLSGRATAVVGGLAVAAAGAVAFVLVHVVAQADTRAAVIAVSTVCDAVVFVGAALLLRLVVPLRGGLVAQPYSLLALDGIFYLLADLGFAAATPGLVAALPTVSAVGGAAGTAAGLAQFALLRRRT